MPQTLRQHMFQELSERKLFHQAQQYAYDYLDTAFHRPVFPQPNDLANLAQFDQPLPQTYGHSSSILQQLHQYGSPATTAQIGGRYFGFVNGSIIPVSLATKWLTDFWDQNAALYTTSPINAKLEEICEKWLRQLLGLPEQTVAGFVSGSSLATFCGLAAGRYRLLQNAGWDVNKKGLNGAPPLRIVASRQAHATVSKAIGLLGLGLDNIEWVNTDPQGRLIPADMPQLDPSTLVILQAGNVNSGSFDPFLPICQQTQATNAWVHIDGAFGLWAAASPSLRHLTKGIELANSWAVDGHKTLNTPYDSGIVLCADKDALIQALQASGDYIVHSQHKDGMFYTPEMSRRARAVELWATLKFLGKAGIDELIVGLHQRAIQFSQELKEAGFTILNEVVFNQVLVSCGDKATTNHIINHIQNSGECWVGGSTWQGQRVIRISVCSWATTPADITRSVQAFITAKKSLM